MNWYKIFYFLQLSDGIKSFFDFTSTIFTFLAFLLGIAYIILIVAYSSQIASSKTINEAQDEIDPELRAIKLAKKAIIRFFYPMLFLSILTWVGYVCVPSKKDCYVIVAGGAVGNFIQSDSAAKKIPTEALQLLRDKMKEESKELSLKSVINDATDTLTGKSKEELIQIVKDQNKQK